MLPLLWRQLRSQWQQQHLPQPNQPPQPLRLRLRRRRLLLLLLPRLSMRQCKPLLYSTNQLVLGLQE